MFSLHMISIMIVHRSPFFRINSPVYRRISTPLVLVDWFSIVTSGLLLSTPVLLFSFFVAHLSNCRAPESFDIVPKTTSIGAGKKNLSQICKVLTQVTSGLEFGGDEPSYVPINDFVRNTILQMSDWFFESMFYLFTPLNVWRKISVANLPDAETHFHAHEFMDATVQPKPIYISLNEIYNIHSMLVQYQSHLVCSSSLNSNLY